MSVSRWNGTADARPRWCSPFPAKPVEHAVARVRGSRSPCGWCTLLLLGFVTRRSLKPAAQRCIGQMPYAARVRPGSWTHYASPASPSEAGVSSPRTSMRTSSPRCRPRTSRGCMGASASTSLVSDRRSKELLGRYDAALPAGPGFQRRRRVHPHVPWPQALGGSRHGSRLARPGCRRRALDRVRLAESPAGPVEMVPGQH
jgi:hypothetical protein